MTNSNLSTVRILSPNHNAPRNNRITKITIHHTAGNIGLENLGNFLANPSRQASYNYGVTTDGRIGLFVEERNRSWASSSPANDHQAITIGVANSSTAPTWEIGDRAWESMINLCVDIIRRNPGITQQDGRTPGLWFDNTPNASLTYHRMFTPTNCPGPFIEARTNKIVQEVNRRLSGTNTPTPPSSGTTAPQTPPTATNGALRIGQNVRITSGSRWLDNNAVIPSFVINRDNQIHSITGDRIVISHGGIVLGAVSRNNIQGQQAVAVPTVGAKVRVNNTATTWATGQAIPNWVRGQIYSIEQTRNNNQELLLSSVRSWIRVTDVTLV